MCHSAQSHFNPFSMRFSVRNHLEMMKMESCSSDTRWQCNTTRCQKSKSKKLTMVYILTECLIGIKQTQPKAYISVYFVCFQRSISENSLVAMDFSGQKSRVIENPSEALSVAVEEGLSWRVSLLLKLKRRHF